MDYRYVSIDDLRYDLKRLKELKMLNVDEMSDDMVLLMHYQVTQGTHPDAPEFYRSDIEFFINLERNIEIDHQMKVAQLEARIHELEERLGMSVDDIRNYASAGD